MSNTHITKKSFLFARILFLILLSSFVANAAGNEVDLTFNAVPSKNLTSSSDANLALQPDGKLIIWGAFQVVNGVPKLRLARLNSDGSLDNSFNSLAADYFSSIGSVVVQPDGKILVAGVSVSTFSQVLRFNPDGTLDNSFVTPWTTGGFNSSANVHAVQADGKILASRNFSGFHIATTSLYRLNANGSVDNSFNQIGFDGWNAKHYLTDLIVLPGGKLLIGGSHSNGTVFRVNTDGSKDTAFESPLLTSAQPQFPPYVFSIAMQSDGKVLFTGSFVSVNGIPRTGLTRLNADGTLDLGFPPVGYNSKVRVFSNDKILVGLTRLNPNGSLDETYTPPDNLSFTNFQIDSLDRLTVFGGFFENDVINHRFTRLGTDGPLDPTFAATAGLAGQVEALAVQADGKVIVTGDFTEMNGSKCSNFVRLNANGALDTSFGAPVGFNSLPNDIAIQGDGKILVAGGFSTYNGLTQPRLARLNSDGSLDTAFVPNVDGDVFEVTLQPDGKILIGGLFSNVNSVEQKALARLNANGTLDGTFTPLFATGSISAIVAQSNGKLIIGGTFNGVSGVARANMARLNANGTVDTSFNAGSISSVYEIIVQPDGKYLVAAGPSVTAVKRLNVDGSVDNTFVSPTMGGSPPIVRRMVLQADGSLVIAGSFYSVNGTARPSLARLTSTGALDSLFFPGGTNGEIRAMVMQPDGKIVIGGTFTNIGATARAGLARLNTSAFVRTVLFDYDGDGKADISVFRASNNYWYVLQSSNGQFTYDFFGANGDIAAPGDYDGDGKTDLAIYRPASGDWWYKSSVTGAFTGRHWGANGDIPRPTDFDNDGKTDFVVFRPSTNMWYRMSNATAQTSDRFFGAAGDKPLVGDFDGDGRGDPAIYRPSTGVFWYLSSIDSVHRAIQWGSSTDIPVPADYDGDGKTDAAVYRASTGFWYILSSSNGSYSYFNFGLATDKPVPADYDGDGKADIAVYRPSTGYWYLQRSTLGFSAEQFGNSTDVPTPNAFVP